MRCGNVSFSGNDRKEQFVDFDVNKDGVSLRLTWAEYEQLAEVVATFRRGGLTVSDLYVLRSVYNFPHEVLEKSSDFLYILRRLEDRGLVKVVDSIYTLTAEGMAALFGGKEEL